MMCSSLTSFVGSTAEQKEHPVNVSVFILYVMLGMYMV